MFLTHEFISWIMALVLNILFCSDKISRSRFAFSHRNPLEGDLFVCRHACKVHFEQSNVFMHRDSCSESFSEQHRDTCFLLVSKNLSVQHVSGFTMEGRKSVGNFRLLFQRSPPIRMPFPHGPPQCN